MMAVANQNEIREQLSALNETLRSIDARLQVLESGHQQRDVFFDEMRPIAKAVMATATDKLQGLDESGYFAFGREALRVADRIVESYSENDVRALGDNIVRIMDTVRAFTQPAILALANDARAVIDNADQLEPTGIFGMVRATRDQDVQRGMSVFLGLLRSLGHGVKLLRPSGPADNQPADPQQAPANVPRPNRSVPAPPEMVQPPATAVPAAAPSGANTVMVDGVAFDQNGYLADASQWTPALCQALAAAQGIALTPRHWAAVEAARNDFASTGASPNIRRLTLVSDVSTKELYQLFPKAPGMTLARVAGLPKPVGCI